MPEQEPKEQTVAKTGESEEDVEALKNSLAEEKTKTDKYMANWQRAEADLINYQRRNEQEKEEIRNFANSTLILELLPFIDDLERAFALIPPKLANQGWVEGIKLAGLKLKSILQSQGLSPIEALDKPFDPRFHEAVRQGNGKEDTVIEEVQKGYIFRNRVIRPTQVVIGNGEEKEEKKEG